jgi:hypothetical protein
METNLVALEQDSGRFGTMAPEEGGALSAPETSAPLTDAFDPAPDSSSGPLDEHTGDPAPSRRRPRANRTPRRAPAKLAGAVANLRDLEDAIVAHLLSAEQVVGRLESRGVHTDAGYSSRADFEQRILASTPFVKAMREAVGTSEPRGVRMPPVGRRPAAARTRRTKSLEFVAQALVELKELNLAIHRAALAARDALVAIESQSLFEECGYLSFEEFLERALGPSPVLASAVALAEREPAPEPGDEPAETVTPEDLEVFEESPSLASDFMNEAPAEAKATADETLKVASAAPVAATRSRFSPKELLVSLALCVAATFGGGAAGSWSAIDALSRTPPESVPTNLAASPPASSHPHVPANAPLPHSPAPKMERAPQAARTVAIDPLAMPLAVPRARAAGPRQARR